MGLIFSVLLVCVGVYEFVQLCRGAGENVNRHSEKIISTNNHSVNSDPTPKIKLCREFLSHEDVEVECPSQIWRRRPGTPSPQRLLVTERDEGRSRSSSPRKFVVSAECEEDQVHLREFFIAKGIPKDNPETKRYVLIDTREEFREVSPLPLPKQFVITQHKTISQEELEIFKQGIGVQLNSITLDGQEIENDQDVSINSPEKAPIETSSYIARSESLTCQKLGTVQKTSSKQEDYIYDSEISSSLCELYAPEQTEFRRDASPYPNLDVLVRKGSISSEFLENSNVDISEVDEDAYNKSTKFDVILTSHNGNTTEYWSNKILVEPSKPYESAVEKSVLSTSAKTDYCSNSVDRNECDNVKLRSKSATRDENSTSVSLMRKISSSSRLFDEDFQASSGLLKDVLERGGDESFRNSLDGVKMGSEARNSFRKKKNKSQNSLENTNEQCGEKSNRVQGQYDIPENTWLIFSGEYTKAMNKDWHGQHFCCWQCDESLTGQRYVLRDDHPYCVSCYESVFANACEKCSRTIGIDSKDLSYKDKHWHEACFLCTTCGESLVDKQFGSKGERIYCGRCYDNQFASRCDGCNEIFRAGTKKMEYKTRQWHEKCFCCCVCKVPIGTQSFIPREQEIYCAKCYEEKFATRCIKCNKVITSGGVTYKNEPWHRECFTCTHCSKSLAGERFTSRDDKPYCAECFGELFAKRCFACNKPITGIGGTKFISFEDRHWHNDCFFCASCRTSLVGRGFITDQEDIICPDCAKQKLL